MQRQCRIAAVAALVLLAITFNAIAGTPRMTSGIAGQVMLEPFPAPGVPPQLPVPVQITISVFAKAGRHLRWIGNFATAEDGTFAIPLPPGTYTLEPAASTPYAGLARWSVTVSPRRVTYDVLDLPVPNDINPWGTFP